jgi:serine protease Do
MSAALESLSEKVSPAVVQILTTGYATVGSGRAGLVTKQRATGSGVILSRDGYILTNGHVVSNARRVRVRVAADVSGGPAAPQPEGRVVEAKVAGIDRTTDIAVLKIEGKDLLPLEFGDSDRLRQGQLVMAFGNPRGLENSVSMGVVSSVARQIEPDSSMVYIQTDAPINPGNSGGPLVDVDGRLMGINTFILSQSGGSEGLGFAIPSNIIKNVYAQLRDTGHVRRGEIGVSAQTVSPALAEGLHLSQDWGVLVADVTPEGPAASAGLLPGDLVLSLNGQAMQNARQLEVHLYRYAVGSKVDIDVLRGPEKLTYSIAVVDRDEDDPQRLANLVDPEKNLVQKLGILGIDIDKTVAPLLPDLRKPYGIVVAAHSGESAYSGDALLPGDVIYAINTLPVSSVAILRAAVEKLKDTEPVVLQVERDGRLMFVALEIE